MTPPVVEYWRVWSDNAGAYQGKPGRPNRYNREEAQRTAERINKAMDATLEVAALFGFPERGDWRPVRVRETVVDDRQPLAANSLADVYAENAALTEALKMARMHHEASANIANADRAALRARVKELEGMVAERTDTLRTFQIAPREPG